MDTLKKMIESSTPLLRWFILKFIWLIRAIVWDIVYGTWVFIGLVIMAGPRLVLFILRILFYVLQWVRVVVIPYVVKQVWEVIWFFEDLTFEDMRVGFLNRIDGVVEFVPDVIIKNYKFFLIWARPQTSWMVYRWTYFSDISFPYLFVTLLADKAKPARERVWFFMNQVRIRGGEIGGAIIRSIIWFPAVVIVSVCTITDEMHIVGMAIQKKIMFYPCCDEFHVVRPKRIISSMFYSYFQITEVIGILCIIFFILGVLTAYAIEWVLNRQMLGLSSKRSIHFQLTERICIPLYWLTEKLLFEMVHSFTWLSHAVWYIGALFYMWILFFVKAGYRSIFPLTWWYYCGWQLLWMRRPQDWVVRLNNDYLSLKWWIGPDYEIVYKILMYWGRLIDYYCLFYIKQYFVFPIVHVIMFLPRLVIHQLDIFFKMIGNAIVPNIPWVDWVPSLLADNYELFFATYGLPMLILFKLFFRTLWYGGWYIKLDALCAVFQLHGLYWYTLMASFLIPIVGRYTVPFVPGDDISVGGVIWLINS